MFGFKLKLLLFLIAFMLDIKLAKQCFSSGRRNDGRELNSYKNINLENSSQLFQNESKYFYSQRYVRGHIW